MKGILKRCTAAFLVAALVITSISSDGFVASAETDNSVAISNVDLIVKNYGEEGSNILTKDETTIYESGALKEIEYLVEKPTGEDTSVDSDNNMVYANNIVGDGYKWVAESADVQISGEDAIHVKLEAVEGQEYDVAASYDPGEAKDYTVNVNYSLYITVDKDEQFTLLNLPALLSEAEKSMYGITEASYLMDEIIEAVATNDNIQTGMTFFNDELEGVLTEWTRQYEKETYSTLTLALIDSKNGYESAENKIVNMQERGKAYQALAIDTNNEIAVLLKYETLLSTLVTDRQWKTIKRNLEDVQEFVSTAINSNWEICSADYMLKDTVDVNAFLDTLEEMDLIEKNDASVIETTDLFAAAHVVECNVNRYAVTIQMNATAYDERGMEVSLGKVCEVTLNLGEGTTVEEVAKEVETTGFEAATLKEWANYEIGETHYTRTVAPGFEGGLKEDATYVITYAPKQYTVSYVEDGDYTVKDETVYYGQIITLPKETNGKWYSYTLGDKTYEQEATYRVLGDVEFNVVKGNAKEKVRVYDLIAEYYGDISNEAKTILLNKAVNDEYIYIRLMDDTRVKYVEGEGNNADYISVPKMTASEGMAWKPVKVEVLNEGKVVQEITSFEDGKAYIDEALENEYTDIKVDYILDVTDVSESDVKDALGLADLLATEAKAQLADLNALASKEYKDNLSQITAAILKQLINSDDPDMPQLSAESLAAVQNILDDCMDGNQLKLLTYVGEYESLDNAGKLEYYYNNYKYEEIKMQANLLAENFKVLVKDEKLDDVLTYFGQGSKVAMLEEASEKLDKLTTKFAPKNEVINVNYTSYTEYSNLVKAIVNAIDKVKDHSNLYEGLYMTEVINPTVPNRSSVTITVLVEGSNESYSEGFTYNKEVGLTADDIKNIEAIVKKLNGKVTVDKELYSSNESEVVLPEVGATGTISLKYVWTPNEYTVEIQGAESVTVSVVNASITLPGSGDVNVDYVYTIGNRTVRVGQNYTNISLSTDELKELFANSTTYTITRTEIDKKTEANEKFFAELNSSIVSAGAQDAASFVPYKDANGNVVVVLKMNPFSSSLSKAMMQIVQTCAMKASYVAIGGETFVEGDIFMNAIVQAVLNNNNAEGVGTESIDAIIDANGNITENAKDKVEGYNVITNTVNGINTTELGGILVETTMAVEYAENVMPLYITLEDYDKNATQLAKVDAALAKVRPHAEVVCKDGKAEVVVNIPEKAYEFYLAAMAIEGQIDLQNFEAPTFAEMVDYAESLENDILFGEDATATGKTIANTAAMVGIDVSSYIDIMNKALKAVRTILNTEGYFVEYEVEATDTYAFTLSYPAIGIVDAMKMELEGGLRNKVKGDLVVPVEVVAPVCNTEYEALVVRATKDVLNIYDLTKDLNATLKDIKSSVSETGDIVDDLIAEAKATTVVVLLDDVDEITTNGVTILDLNGHKVNKLTANESTFIINSNLYVKGSIAEESGKVVRSGSEEFYTIEKDADGNYIVSIAADILEIDKMPAVKDIAKELIGIIALNEYTSAALSIDGNEIYDILVEDVIAAYKGGLKNLASDLVECFNEAGTEAFVNTFIKDVTDFAAIEEALLTEEGIVAEYKLATAPWDVTLEKANNYLTANIASGVVEEKTLTVKFVGDKQELADLAGELADIVTEKDITVSLGDIAYDPTNGFSAAGVGADINITIDLTKSDRDYLTVVAVIIANGMKDPSEMVDAINEYLETGYTSELVDLIETTTLSQILTSIKDARNVAFIDMINGLGINVEDTDDVIALANVYYDVLNLGSVIINKLGFTGGNQVLASCKTDEYATYTFSKENWKRMNINLKFVLAEEIRKPVVPDAIINVPTVDVKDIYGAEVDAENKIIFIDANWEGIKASELKAILDFGFVNVQNTATDVEWTFTAGEDALVRTGDTITVTAWNAEQEEPVKVSATYKIIIMGDTNKDGKATVNDVGLANDSIVGQVELDEDATLAANMNQSTGEHIITVNDVALIQQKFTHENDYDSFLGEEE